MAQQPSGPPTSPFIGPTYALSSRPASVQRTINMTPVPLEPGNDRSGWVLRDIPGLVPVTTTLHQCTGGPAWVQTVIPSSRPLSIQWVRDRFMICTHAVGGVQGSILYSTDGVNWAAAIALPIDTSYSPQIVAYGNGVFVASTDETTMTLQSTDGITWGSGTGNPNVSKSRWIWFGNGYFVQPDNTSAIVYVSTSASGQTGYATPFNFTCGAYNAGTSKHYGVKANTGAVYSASDPTSGTWTLVGTTTYTSLTNTVRLVTDGVLTMMALDGTTQRNFISYSNDGGVTWNSGVGLPALAAFYVDLLYLASQKLWMVTDNNGYTYTSVDGGAHWAITTSTLNPFLGVNQNWWLAARPDGFLYAAVPVTPGLDTVAAVGTC